MTNSTPFRPQTLAALVDSARLAEGDLDAEMQAVTDAQSSLTWAEYCGDVARLAQSLVDAGVRPGDRVGVRVPKSVTSFVAVHAVLRAGGVMVPVDALAPLDHAAAVLADAGANILISTARLATVELCAAGGIETVVLPTDDAAEGPAAAGIEVVTSAAIAATPAGTAVDVEPDDPAYIIYTSGSTGRPKGIVHTHASALAYAVASADQYDLVEADRFANIAPLHFDQSTFELYAAPLVGGCVLVVPDPVLRFPASLSKLIEAERITVWYSVPYLLDQLAHRGALDQRDLSALRWVLFGGESFPSGQLANLMEQLPNARFSNVYGPAEVNQCTAHEVVGAPLRDTAVPIGRAWDAAKLLIVEPDNETVEVEPGTPGVLLVQTPTMMREYWNRPDLTSAAISTDRGAAAPGRWYRTGDLVVAQPNGDLVFLGRVDNQIKLRGHRIELEAIDAVLGDIDLTVESTTVVQRRSDADDRLVALIVLGSDIAHEQAVDQVRAELQRCLPRYAVPEAVICVDALPRTGSDKVDRNAALALIDS